MKSLRIAAIAVILSLLASLAWSGQAQTPAAAQTGADVAVEKDIKVAVRDGVKLALDVYLPAKGGTAAAGPHPTLLARTPYNKSAVEAESKWFAARGYAVVVN